jgi:hypothetical protein
MQHFLGLSPKKGRHFIIIATKVVKNMLLSKFASMQAHCLAQIRPDTA